MGPCGSRGAGVGGRWLEDGTRGEVGRSEVTLPFARPVREGP